MFTLNSAHLSVSLLFQQAQVYSRKKLCLYNMFNHHFFEPQAEARFRSFLREAGAGLVLVTDPPFGGMVEPLVATFAKVEETWKAEVKPGEIGITIVSFKTPGINNDTDGNNGNFPSTLPVKEI